MNEIPMNPSRILINSARSAHPAVRTRKPGTGFPAADRIPAIGAAGGGTREKCEPEGLMPGRRMRQIAAAAPAVCGMFAASVLSAAQSVTLPAIEVVGRPLVSETSVDVFAQQTTIVGIEQINALNAQDITSALRRTPGVTITRYNTVGSFGGGEGGALLLRGLGSSRPGGEIKTTVDGVPKANAVFNHPLLDLMSIDLAAEIEVARRAAPLQAGNMFAGVNFVSPRATEPGGFARGTVAGGSFGTFMGKAEAGGRFGAFDAYAGQSYRSSDGHRPDSDGRLTNYVLRLGWRPHTSLSFDYLLNRTDNRASDPGPLGATGTAQTRGDVYETEDWLHIVTAGWDLDRGEGSLKFYRGDGEANWHRRLSSGNADSLNDSRLEGVRGRQTLRVWDGVELIAGADYDRSRGRTHSVPATAAPTVTFGPQEFRLFSAYTGVAHTLEFTNAWSITSSVGARYYDHDAFGTKWAPQAGMVARSGGTQLHASYGRAVNYPGLDVAAFSTVAVPALASSWPLLRPEQLDQFEVGIRQELTPGIVAELTLFHNRGTNRYVWQAPPPRYLNQESFRTQGGEFTIAARAGETLSVFGGVSHLEARPADLPYAPRWSVVGGAAWRPADSFTINIDASYTGEQRAGSQTRIANSVNSDSLHSFTLWNARVAYHFLWAQRDATLFVAAENLFDRDYAYRPGYPMPGIGGTVGFTIGF
jgi:outer membrane cobalamin receptor